MGDVEGRGTTHATTLQLLAADVGGTYARIGLVQVDGETISLGFHQRYACLLYTSRCV